MTDKPTFDPRRSAAIRELLIETVDAEPRRHRRHLRTLLGGLVITGIVASGTAALALNRDSLFTAPAPSATSSNTEPTTSATPSPGSPSMATPTPTPAIAVATAPIVPHDLAVPPTGTGWSVDLPSTAGRCQQHDVLNVADGLALVQIGPILIDDAALPEGCDLANDGVSLSMVDTASGQLVWSRDWSWDATQTAAGSSYVKATILGGSGRLLVNSLLDFGGPNEVLDLATGDSVSQFSLEGETEQITSIHAVPGDSGDVYATLRLVDADGSMLPRSILKRFDPMDASQAEWSIEVPGVYLEADEVLNNLGYTTVRYSSVAGGPSSFGVLDLATGQISPRSQYTSYKFFTGYTIRPSSYDDPPGTAVTLTGLDDGGNQIWTRTEPPASGVSELLTASARPGGDLRTLVGTGRFLVTSPESITLADGLTGGTIWSVEASGCGLEQSMYANYPAYLSNDGGAITLVSYGDVTCRFDAATGARLDDQAVAPSNLDAHGESNTYHVLDGTATAYDTASGEIVWSAPTDDFCWFYAGGHLVTLEGSTLRSIS